VVELVKAHHQATPTDAGLSLETIRQGVGAPVGVVEEVIERLGRRGTVRQQSGVVSLSGFTPIAVGGADGLERLVALVVEAGLEAPTLAELAERLGIGNAGPSTPGPSSRSTGNGSPARRRSAASARPSPRLAPRERFPRPPSGRNSG
jgi:hypothetical protein